MRVLLGICGVGAAVASPQHVLHLRELGCDVRIAATENALRFLARDVLEAFSRGYVFSSVFEKRHEVFIPHVELNEWCDVVLVMPASADLLSRVAVGAANDIVSACVLHATAPVAVVPALNETLAGKPAVLRNLRRLARDGIHVIGPVAGSSILAAKAARVGTAMPSIEYVVAFLRRVREERGHGATAVSARNEDPR